MEMKSLWREHQTAPELRLFFQEWGIYKTRVENTEAMVAELKKVLVDDGYEKRLRDVEQQQSHSSGKVTSVIAATISAVVGTVTAIVASFIQRGKL